MKAREIDRLRGPVLRSVSRSFYLSLRVLPRPLRDPLSLAYLLARATDTIADTPAPPAELRVGALRDLARAIQGETPVEAVMVLRSSFAPLQSDEAERALIEALPDVLQWLSQLDERDRHEVRQVLTKINEGQMLDLERFGAHASTSTSVRALLTSDDLDQYTYLVAGCVGEFWTRLCFLHMPNFSDRSDAEMLALGVQYGKGLQLINILRDVGSDLRAGRCYLPFEELYSVGLTPAEILGKPVFVEPILRSWQAKAEKGLVAGLDYACAIRSRRVRFATALPALIGARTLALLREAGTEVFERTVKMPRTEVREIVSAITLKLASAKSLRKNFDRLSK